MHSLEKVVTIIGIVALGMTVVGIMKKPSSIYKNDPNQQNPMEGKRIKFVLDEKEEENADGQRGHLESLGTIEIKTNTYDKLIKRIMDVILSFLGLIILCPILFSISIAIIVSDPGPVFFIQKRVGKNKQYFKLHKFRSMKMSTPHDIPTHMLSNPDQYITKTGRFIRLHSLDELPQIWDIFIGNMSIIGPRPALWNQDILIAERDKYGANDIRPGLTGWAQINGRDELNISVKAKMDGEYASRLQKGGLSAFWFDCCCFLGTIFNVIRGDGVVEGKTNILYTHSVDINDKKTVYNDNNYWVKQ